MTIGPSARRIGEWQNCVVQPLWLVEPLPRYACLVRLHGHAQDTNQKQRMGFCPPCVVALMDFQPFTVQHHLVRFRNYCPWLSYTDIKTGGVASRIIT